MSTYKMRYGKHEGNWNWHSFNVDPSAPADIIKLFETESNVFAPSNFNVSCLRNDDGSYNDVIRYISHSGGFGQIRVRYGFYEPSSIGGREYMISNAFLSPSNIDSLDDPNALVEVKDDNFGFLFEENPDFNADIKKCGTFSIKSAMDTLRITQEDMNNIMKCVFISMFDKRDCSTFFVINEFSEDKFRALVYLVLSFLPHPLRYGICFSNADNSVRNESKNYVIVEKNPISENYYNINSGETSINLDIVKKRPNLFPFCELLESCSVDEYLNYCIEIKNASGLFELQNNHTYRDILLLSKLMLKEKYYSELSKSYLIEYLDEVTDCRWKKTSALKEYYIGLVKYVFKSGCILESELYDRIYTWVSEIGSQEFLFVYHELVALRLLRLPEAELADFLDAKDGEEDDWLFWLDIIYKIGGEKDKKQVIAYFTKRISAGSNIDFLRSVGERLLSTSFYDSIKKMFFNKLIECYASEIIKNLYSIGHIEKEFADYKKDTVSIFDFSSEDYEIKKSGMIKSVVEAILRVYDVNTFSFEESYVECIKLLMTFADFPKNIKCLVEIFEETKQIAFATDTQNLTETYLNKISSLGSCSSSFKYELIEKLYQFITDTLKNRRSFDLEFWYRLTDELFSVFPKRPSAVQCMINYELPVVSDEEFFESAIFADKVSEDFVIVLIKEYETFIEKCNSKSVEGKTAKACLALLKKRKKELEKNKKSKNKAERTSGDEKVGKAVKQHEQAGKINNGKKEHNDAHNESESSNFAKVKKKLFLSFRKK